jgi:hypothetical protein
VIPEIIKVKGRVDAGVEFDVSALRKRWSSKHILQVDLVIKIYCEFFP